MRKPEPAGPLNHDGRLEEPRVERDFEPEMPLFTPG